MVIGSFELYLLVCIVMTLVHFQGHESPMIKLKVVSSYFECKPTLSLCPCFFATFLFCFLSCDWLQLFTVWEYGVIVSVHVSGWNCERKSLKSVCMHHCLLHHCYSLWLCVSDWREVTVFVSDLREVTVSVYVRLKGSHFLCLCQAEGKSLSVCVSGWSCERKSLKYVCMYNCLLHHCYYLWLCVSDWREVTVCVSGWRKVTEVTVCVRLKGSHCMWVSDWREVTEVTV